MPQEKSGWHAIGEFLHSVVVAVVLAALIRIFLFQPFYIPSGSMEPTLLPGDRIIVNKLVYRFSGPQQGDIIVFRYPIDPSKDYIKRLIAKGGSTVAIHDGRVYVDGKELNEPYLPPGEFSTNPDPGPITVPPGTYFMMGDNRNNSQDSRYWGPMPEENIVGRAEVVFWPPGRVGRIR